MHKFACGLSFLLALTSVAAPAAAGIAIFDQNTDSIQVSGQSVLGSAATIEAVVRLPSGAPGGLFFNEWTNFQEDKQVSVSASTFQAYLHPIQPIFTGTLTLTADAWHHVAFVYDGLQDSQERFYVDGVRVATVSASGSAGNGDGLAYVGAIPRDGGCTLGFVGEMDSLRVSAVARYSGETFSAPIGDLASDADTLLLYNFDDLPGSTTVTDSSPLDRTGTLGLGCGGATSPDVAEGGATTTTTVPATTTTTVAATTTSSTTSTTVAVGVCGDPIDPPTLAAPASPTLGGRAVSASDALNILLVAVDVGQCALCVCDVDDSGAVTATDALVTLAYVVGQEVPLTCPPCAG